MSYPQPNYGAPPQGGATGKSSIGLEGNVAAAIGYVVGILALVLIVVEKDNRFVRFHAIQSVLYAAIATALMIGLVIVSMILGFVAAAVADSLGLLVGVLATLIYFGVILAFLAGLVFAAYKAYQGEMFKLPVVGNLAEKFAK